MQQQRRASPSLNLPQNKQGVARQDLSEFISETWIPSPILCATKLHCWIKLFPLCTGTNIQIPVCRESNREQAAFVSFAYAAAVFYFSLYFSSLWQMIHLHVFHVNGRLRALIRTPCVAIRSGERWNNCVYSVQILPPAIGGKKWPHQYWLLFKVLFQTAVCRCVHCGIRGMMDFWYSHRTKVKAFIL